MPVGVPSQSPPNIEHVGYICDVWGRCWWRPYYGYYGVPAYSGTTSPLRWRLAISRAGADVAAGRVIAPD